MTIAMAILLAFSCPLWLLLALNAVTIHRGDPAGRGLAVAYGAANAGLLLVALGALFAVAAVDRRVPWWLGVCLLVLVPAACAAGLGTLTLLGRYTRMRWAAMSPVLAPALLLGLAIWCRWGRPIGTAPRAGELAMLGGIAVLCVLPWLGWLVAPRIGQAGGQPADDGGTSGRTIEGGGS